VSSSAEPNASGRAIRRRSNAELVADDLREAIVRGELADGTVLPNLEILRRQFGVGLPAAREAIRILESEDLVTVIRGNVGGAVVHAPGISGAASRLDMVLHSQNVGLADLGEALRALEPLCAKLCAERADDATVRVLGDLVERASQATDDDQLAITLNREFHEALVAGCRNRTLQVVVGSLEMLWSDHELGWARNLPSRYNMENRMAGIHAHARVLDAIRARDGAAAYVAMSEHLAEGYTYAVPQTESDTSAVKRRPAR
jgi:GntR family transcriptional repressor for pyruvate dehydrogenase complex